MSIPYQVLLSVEGDAFRCGGSIISPLLILTAAQCVQQWRSNPSRLKVTAGTPEPSAFGGQKSMFEQIRNAEEIYIHEHFHSWGDDAIPANDIALIKLNMPFDFGFAVWNIQLPEKWEKFHASVTASGWGDTEQGPFAPPSILMYAEVPIMPNDKCKRIYGESQVNENIICGENSEKGACSGDNGGPAVCKRRGKGQSVLCGVISMGQACKINPLPDIYTKVSSYLGWIKSIQKSVQENVAYDEFDAYDDNDEVFHPIGRLRSTSRPNPAQGYNNNNNAHPTWYNRMLRTFSDVMKDMNRWPKI